MHFYDLYLQFASEMPDGKRKWSWIHLEWWRHDYPDAAWAEALVTAREQNAVAYLVEAVGAAPQLQCAVPVFEPPLNTETF